MRSYYKIAFTQVNHALNNWCQPCQYCYNLDGLPTHGCRLSTRIFAVSYDWLTKSSDEMSTKTSRILVLVLVDEKTLHLTKLA